jgi:hypothetical protein
MAVSRGEVLVAESHHRGGKRGDEARLFALSPDGRTIVMAWWRAP